MLSSYVVPGGHFNNITAHAGKGCPEPFTRAFTLGESFEGNRVEGKSMYTLKLSGDGN